MSTLNVSNISDGTDSVPTGYVVNGSAKAWVNFNGTGTVAIRDGMNVSGLVDNGTGDYDVNFTSSFADVNHVGSGLAGDDGHFLSYRNGIGLNSALMANIAITIHSGARTDLDLITFITHGDLA